MDDTAGGIPAIATDGGTWRFPANRPLRLDSGASLARSKRMSGERPDRPSSPALW